MESSIRDAIGMPERTGMPLRHDGVFGIAFSSVAGLWVIARDVCGHVSCSRDLDRDFHPSPNDVCRADGALGVRDRRVHLDDELFHVRLQQPRRVSGRVG